MKAILVILMVGSLTACGTLGGAVSGMGEDLQKAGQWIRN